MLKNKTVVALGSEGLLGKEFVRSLKANNATVIRSDIADINDDDYKKCDITDKNSVIELIDHVKHRYGKIDAVVNSAYPRNKNYGRKFEEVEYEDFCENVDLHLGGYFLVMQQFAEYFKTQGYGNIINIASIYGVMPPRFEIYEDTNMTMPVEYNVIKHSIISLSKYVAKYYKNQNIRINCISPGGIYNNQPEGFVRKYNEYALNKGMLDTVDVSGVLIFLVSDMSRYINGQNIVVDDGWSL